MRGLGGLFWFKNALSAKCSCCSCICICICIVPRPRRQFLMRPDTNICPRNKHFTTATVGVFIYSNAFKIAWNAIRRRHLTSPRRVPLYARAHTYITYIYSDPSETSTQSKTTRAARTLQAEAFAMSQRKHWSLLSLRAMSRAPGPLTHAKRTKRKRSRRDRWSWSSGCIH